MTARGGRSPLLLVAVWLAGALAATATGLLAVQLVGDQVGDPPAVTLTTDEVDQALAAVPEASPSAPPTEPAPATAVPTAPVVPPSAAPASAAPATAARPSAVPPPAAPAEPSAARPFSNAGGSAGVRCRGGVPEIVYASPAQGYRLDEQKVEGGRADIRFRSEESDARLRVVCSRGQPVLESSDDD